MTILHHARSGDDESDFGDDDGGLLHNGAAGSETAWNKRTLAKVGCQFRFKTGDQADWSDWNDGATI
jgi:hypothetical protein